MYWGQTVKPAGILVGVLVLVILPALAVFLWCGWRDVKRLRKLRGDD